MCEKKQWKNTIGKGTKLYKFVPRMLIHTVRLIIDFAAFLHLHGFFTLLKLHEHLLHIVDHEMCWIRAGRIGTTSIFFLFLTKIF